MPPMADQRTSFEELIRRARQGNGDAGQGLPTQWRPRLHRKNGFRMDPRRALAQLRRRDREVLVLRYLEQLSTQETAAELAITEAAVKLRVLRAVQRLRAHLGDLLEEES
jgi:RNA polymerase sigma factor (sigma-70 family)